MYYVGIIIKKMREIRKLTQENISNRLNLQQNAISRVENSTNSPRFDIICKICDVLQIPPGELWSLVKMNEGKSINDVLKIVEDKYK